MFIIPLMVAMVTFLSAAVCEAQCPPNSWKIQPNLENSELEPSDFDWLKERRYSKQKYALDLSQIASKRDMRIVASAYWDITGVESLARMKKPYPANVLDAFRDGSTGNGFHEILDKNLTPRIGITGICFKNWSVLSDDRLELAVAYKTISKTHPFITRRLLFIRSGDRWLFDRIQSPIDPSEGD